MHAFTDEVCLDIAAVAKELRLTPEQFRPLRPSEDWKGIEERIYQRFLKPGMVPGQILWLWECFVLPEASVVITKWPHTWLEQLVEPDERVWFFVNGRRNKLWFYEGLAGPINRIVHESSAIDEFYVCSRKYSWLLCVNHHDYLIATGDLLPEKLRALAAAEQ